MLIYDSRADYQEAAEASKPCPLRGCWAHELACGSVEAKLDVWAQQYSGALLNDLRGLNTHQREALLTVWDTARKYTRYIIELKFKTFSQLPWILCGLGNSTEGLAREAGRKARDAWTSSAHLTKAHAPLTLLVFQDRHMRAELDSFVDGGAALVELPLLKRLAMKLRLTRCCELSVERLHRMAALAVQRSPSAGGSYISWWSGRRQEVLTHVFGAAMSLEARPLVATPGALAKAFDAARNSVGMVKLLQLEGHAHWVTAPGRRASLGLKFKASQATKECAAMMYRYDLPSMFAKHRKSKAIIDRATLARKRTLQKAIAKAASQWAPPSRDTAAIADRLLCRAAYDHFREHAEVGGVMYTMPKVSPLRSLSNTVANHCDTQESARDPCDLSSLRDDVADGDALASATNLHEHSEVGRLIKFHAFTIVHRAPKRQRLFAAVGNELRTDHMAVAALHVESRHSSGGRLDAMGVSSESVNDNHTFMLSNESFVGIGYQRVKSSIRRWTRGEVRHYISLPAPGDLKADAMEMLVTGLVRNGAAAGDAAALPAGMDTLQHECLTFLAQQGFLQQLPSGCWQFTDLALPRLRAKWMARTPELVMVPRNCPIEECTRWELCEHLFSTGWSLDPLPPRPTSPLVLSLDIADAAELSPEAKRFYFRPRSQADLGRSYLLVLAKCMALKAKGLHQIEHGAKAAYYVDLLKSNAIHEPQNPMLDDTADVAAVDDIDEAAADADWLAQELEDAMAQEEDENEDAESQGDDDADDGGVDALSGETSLPLLHPRAKESAAAPLRRPARQKPRKPAAPGLSGETIPWGPFRFLHVMRGDKNAFQCTCPYHNDPADGLYQRCRKTKNWHDDSDESREKTLLQLKSWCLAGRHATSRKIGGGHLHCPLDIAGTAEELDTALAAALSERRWILDGAEAAEGPGPGSVPGPVPSSSSGSSSGSSASNSSSES